MIEKSLQALLVVREAVIAANASDSLHDSTSFSQNAIGIDPPGCGCTDCVVHDSYPLEESAEAISAFFVKGRPLTNRTGEPITLFLAMIAAYPFAGVLGTGKIPETLVRKALLAGVAVTAVLPTEGIHRLPISPIGSLNEIMESL